FGLIQQSPFTKGSSSLATAWILLAPFAMTIIAKSKRFLLMWFITINIAIYFLLVHRSIQEADFIAQWALMGFVFDALSYLPTSISDWMSFQVLAASLYQLLMVAFASMLIVSLPVLMLALAPLETMTRRLNFIITGLIFLVALNELSHYAPTIRPWLKPPVLG